MKEFINGLSEEFDDYYVVNGEVGVQESEGDEEDIVYRCDKPIISIFLDEEGEELCFLHQTREDVAEIYDFEKGEEIDKKENGNTEENKG